MAKKIDLRQSELRTAQSMIGSGANATADTLFPLINDQLAKLFEDRNVLLINGGEITFTGTDILFTEDLELSINQKVAGGAPTIVSLGSSTVVLADNEIWYATVNRGAGTAVMTVASSLPAVVAANQEIFLIAKRVDAGDGTQRVYWRNGMAMDAGQTVRLGASGGDGNLEDFPLVNNQVSPANITGFEFDEAETKIYKVEYSISRIYGSPAVQAGSLATTFTTNATAPGKFNNSVHAIVTQPDGKILVGGAFTNYGGTSGRSYFIRLNQDGTLDTAFNTNATDSGKFNNLVRSIAIQADGKILVGGDFTSYNGSLFIDRFIRLNSDGTYDSAFTAQSSGGGKFSSGPVGVFAIAVQLDQKILVGGFFEDYNGNAARDYFIRLNTDGTTDVAFCVDATDSKFSTLGVVRSIAVQLDQKILIGGDFTTYGTAGRDYLARLNTDGTTDVAFVTNAVDSSKFSSFVYSIAVRPDQQILIGGDFINYGTAGRDRFIGLNPDGTVDVTFCSNASSGSVFNARPVAIQPLSDNKVALGGNFTDYLTSGRNYFAVLNSNGTIDASTSVSSNSSAYSNSILAISSWTDDRMYVGGTFVNYNGDTDLDYFIGLNQDIPAIDNEYLTYGKFVALYKSGSWIKAGEELKGDTPETDLPLDPSGQMTYTTSNLSGTAVESVLKFKKIKM